MIGNKHVLDVYLGNNLIGHLSVESSELIWSYTNNWLENGYPISPHLPLNNKIPNVNTQIFLRNLLPEGQGLDELLSNFHLSKYNTFGLIRALGLDTPGSLVFTPHDKRSLLKTSFREITVQELTERLDRRDNYSLIFWDGKPRLSVAGVQDKINVVLNAENNLGFGEGNLCSTHILKFERQKLSYLVLNEYLSMSLAKSCGLPTANCQLMRFGKNSALLVERFDRKFESISNVKRRHIIDGCQALNLPPEYKYERNFGNGRDVQHIRDGANLKSLFLFAGKTTNPAFCKQHIVDWVIYNLLIYNCDAHGKNISFFVGAKGLSLAPFYDLVNIKMYTEFEHELAMAIGDEFNEEHIDAYQLADFADNCGLSRILVTKRIALLCQKLEKGLIGIENVAINQDELEYIAKYKKITLKRCQKLLSSSKHIKSVKIQ